MCILQKPSAAQLMFLPFVEPVERFWLCRSKESLGELVCQDSHPHTFRIVCCRRPSRCPQTHWILCVPGEITDVFRKRKNVCLFSSQLNVVFNFQPLSSGTMLRVAALLLLAAAHVSHVAHAQQGVEDGCLGQADLILLLDSTTLFDRQKHQDTKRFFASQVRSTGTRRDGREQQQQVGPMVSTHVAAHCNKNGTGKSRHTSRPNPVIFFFGNCVAPLCVTSSLNFPSGLQVGHRGEQDSCRSRVARWERSARNLPQRRLQQRHAHREGARDGACS